MLKKTTIAMAVAVATTLTLSASAAEQQKYEIGGGLSHFLFDDDMDLNDDTGLRGLLGYRFSDRWGMELVLDKLSTETDMSGLDADVTQYFLSGLYHFNVDSNVQPYLSLGWGQGETEVGSFSNESTATNVGAGIKWFLNENFAVRPSVNHFFNTEYDEDHTTVGLTLSYLWGGASAPKPTPAPKPTDRDGDGVADASDRCGSTPSGVSVNAMGCPLDTDGDGVYDYQDKCASTAAKLKVDAKGCPVKLTDTVSIDLNVNFDSNSDVVKAQYFSEIRRVAKFLSQYQGTKAVIEGHTDTSGSAAYNKSLSQRRADSVARVLVQEMGVAQSRVSAMGYGEERPIADESTREGREANRRVVAKVSATVESMEAK
ncbi:OmpA family protein [Teredinibacter haidensis]|uniref:OmpA family protein n=1 Tax=Teredinibacter haidensis TaxID=2731755 RepID=UPI000948BFAE|nr:OmpA family protein [Teredinibacter haidensis]